MNKLLMTAVAGLSMVAAPIAASAAPWGGHDRGDFRRGDRGDDGGAAVAAGLFGLVLGAAIADSAHSHPVYERSYYYDESPYRRCGWVDEPYRNYWGGVDYQQVWVCR